MELTKQDTKKAKGVAVIGMIMLHLFCRLEHLPYTPLLWVGDAPLVYYLGLLGDICVPIYCFCSGYAHYLLWERDKHDYYKRIPVKLLGFLLNYWAVLILFVLLGLLTGSKTIPGSLSDFCGNLFVYRLSYNGAWWFVLTYILLLLLSPLSALMTKKLHPLPRLTISFAIYCAAYLLRYKVQVELHSELLSRLLSEAALLGTSQLGYVAGTVCRKYRLLGKLRDYTAERRRLKTLIAVLLPSAAFFGHCVVQSVFVAPFVAAAVLISLFVSRQPKALQKTLLFFGNHSTNLWLSHMFFYMTLFDGLVFSAEYPLPVLAFELVLCLLTSFAVKLLLKALYGLRKICRKEAGGLTP